MADADADGDDWPDYFAFEEPYDNQADAIESAIVLPVPQGPSMAR